MRIAITIGLINIVVAALVYWYLRASLPQARSKWFTIPYVLLSLNSAFIRGVPQGEYAAFMAGLWFGLLVYTLMLAVFHTIIRCIAKLMGKKLPNRLIAGAIIICSTIICGIGVQRAFSPMVTTYELTTQKLPAGSSYRIALISDVHLGQILGGSYAARLKDNLNAQKPDMVLIAGDLLDERIPYVEKSGALKQLEGVNAPMGTYLAFGNHDYLDRPNIWQAMVEEHGIKVLRDESTIVDNKLKITGLNDWRFNHSTMMLKELSKDNQKYYSILLDHQPRRQQEAADWGYDLYLSGHTHTGQLFPIRQVTKRMYWLDYGEAALNQLTAITSSGYGFWGIPIRTENRPEIVILNVKGV